MVERKRPKSEIDGFCKKNRSVDLSPYAGDWVALVNGRVVGIAKTAHEALLAARYQRLKEEPSLIWVPKPINENT